MSKRRQQRKSRKSHKKQNRRRRTMKRGGSCGCSGTPKLFGGSPHLNDVPTSAYYSYNSNLANDPNNPTNIQAARFAGDFSRTTGGKRRTKRSGGRRLRQRGGVNFFNGLYNQMAATGSGMNHITSMGVVNGVNNQSNIITGVGPVSNTSVTSQPVLTQPYGFSNMPLA